MQQTKPPTTEEIKTTLATLNIKPRRSETLARLQEVETELRAARARGATWDTLSKAVGVSFNTIREVFASDFKPKTRVRKKKAGSKRQQRAAGAPAEAEARTDDKAADSPRQT